MTNLRPKKLELAGIKGGRDITRPFFGAMLEPLDTVLGAIGRDYLVYEELFKDSQVFSNFQQRISRVAACETTIEAGGDRPIDIAAAEFLEALLKRLPWDDITTLMLYGRMFGYSVAEVMWGFDGKFTTIDSIQVRSQRRFRFDQDLNLRLLTLTNSYEGEVLPDRKFWTVAMGGVRSDEPYGLGLGHQLYWPVYFKKNGLKSWLKFLDRFGHPLPLVRHSENATQAEKDAAFYLAQSLAEDSAAAGSENLTFDLIESTRNGTADYQQLITAMDAQISKIILSQTMTTDSGSSRSQATVHDAVARAIIKADADVICASFNQSIVRWLTEFNFPGANPPRVWRRTEPDNDLTAQADRDKVLVDMGFPPTAEYIIETYGEGFRPPEKGEDSVIALNGAQVTALKDIISTAVSDSWFPELAIATVRASFPTVPGDLIQAIGDQLKAQQDGQTKDQEAVMAPDRAAALFGETADFAAKKSKKGKKNCEKGKICKGSCISKTKNCLSDMNPAQLKAHKAAQRAARKVKAKGGGGGETPDAVAIPAIVPIAPPTPTDPTDGSKIIEFPSDSDLKAAKKESFGDPDASLNAKDVFTADINGQKFFIKGNSPLPKDWEGWDNIDKVTMAKQLKSEVATKAIADLVGVGEYYLPIKEYGRGRAAKVVTPFIEAKPAWDVNVGKLSMPEPDRRKLLALDYALGALDRHGGNVMIGKNGKPYMIDNGLNFGKHLGPEKTNYYAWSNNSNFLKSGMNLYDEKLDRSHIQGILDNKASIIKIAKDKGLDYKSVEKRINELDAAKTWDDIL